MSNQPITTRLAVAALLLPILIGATGCGHFPTPWLDTHATWMNATGLTVCPPKSAAAPRKTQPYCAVADYHGYYGECWRQWPEYWEETQYSRCYGPSCQPGLGVEAPLMDQPLNAEPVPAAQRLPIEVDPPMPNIAPTPQSILPMPNP